MRKLKDIKKSVEAVEATLKIIEGSGKERYISYKNAARVILNDAKELIEKLEKKKQKRKLNL